MPRVPSVLKRQDAAEDTAGGGGLTLGYFRWPPRLLVTGLRSSCAGVHADLVELQPGSITLDHPGGTGDAH
ncbi:UNVERIFIED_CONTAM: hypothetical protein FKN15_051954 [Acipenser sinensis]